MPKLDYASEVRVEVVTTTFVASGVPDGVHDLGRLLENLNNPTMSRQIELPLPVEREVIVNDGAVDAGTRKLVTVINRATAGAPRS